MGNLSPGERRQQRGEPGVAEQIEQPERPSAAGGLRRPDLRAHPVPMCDLLREDPDMAERHEAAQEFDFTIGQRPSLGQSSSRREPPAARSFLLNIAGEHSIGVLPAFGAQPRPPQRLRLGPHHGDRAVALELLAVAYIEEPVVIPARRLQHHRPPLRRARAGGGGVREVGRSGQRGQGGAFSQGEGEAGGRTDFGGGQSGRRREATRQHGTTKERSLRPVVMDPLSLPPGIVKTTSPSAFEQAQHD